MGGQRMPRWDSPSAGRSEDSTACAAQAVGRQTARERSPLRCCEDVRRISPRRAGRPQGVREGSAHQDGTLQALAEERTAPQGGLRAYVALRRCDPLRARLRREAYGLLSATSCYEVSQPGGCLHLAKSSGWRRRGCTQHIRPR